MSSDVQELFAHIPSGWGCMKLSDCTIDGNISYGIVQPGQDVENGIPIIRVNNVNNGQLQLTDVLRVSPEIEDKYKRTRLEGGEVLLTLVGSTGQSFVAPKELAGWNVPRAIAVIRPKDEIGANWINICLQSKPVQHFLDVRANTTVQKTLNLKDVRDIPIPIPPEPVKEQIESIAVNLEGKIKLNRQTNQTLEQIAQAIFKSWFVDFDPVRAKIAAREAFIQQHPEVTEEAIRAAAGTEGDTLAHAGAKACELAAICAISGKTPEQLNQLNPETQQQVKTTAALFPDALVDSELGEVPEGWEYKPLSKLVELIGGGTPKKSEDNYWGGDIPWFSVKDAPSDGDVFVVDTEQKITELGLNKSSTKLLPVGTTIISARGTVGRLALVGQEMAMNQSCYGVNGVNGIGPYLNYFNLKEAVTELQQNTHGAVFDTITRDTFDTVSLVEPCMELKKKFDVLVEPLLQRIMSNLLELVVLCDTRDILLPKLLSGELHIVDAITADMVKGVANG